MTESRAGSLARRFTAVLAAVVAVTLAAVVVTAFVVAPPVFDQHLHEAGHGGQPGVLLHAQEAFRSAGWSAVVAGGLVAAVAAALAGAFLTRRLRTDLDALAAGAERVAAGRYDERVVLTGTGRELDAVAGAFNAMAEQIEETETTRRRLLTDLSHEIRTPLAVLDVTLEAVEDGVAQLDEATLATLRAQTRRLARLAGDLKDVSAAEEGRLGLRTEAVDLRDLVASAARASAPGAQAAGVELRTEVGDRAIRVEADPTRIGQVLDNLLRNALQHTPEDGVVQVRLRAASSGAVVEVADSGVGVPSADLPHLFERFYRVAGDRPRGGPPGTGVGLAISRAIAAAHRGTLTAASPGEGRGATFTLTLPLSSRPSDLHPH